MNAFIAVIFILVIAFGTAVASVTVSKRETRRIDRRIHERHHGGTYTEPSCVHCTTHDWDKWRLGTCACQRCANIRRLERDTLDGAS